jgi:hypothetical protein
MATPETVQVNSPVIGEELIEMSRAAIVRAEASQTANVELPGWIAP